MNTWNVIALFRDCAVAYWWILYGRGLLGTARVFYRVIPHALSLLRVTPWLPSSIYCVPCTPVGVNRLILSRGMSVNPLMIFFFQQDRQCMHKVTSRHVRVTVVAVEKQVLRIRSVCL